MINKKLLCSALGLGVVLSGPVYAGPSKISSPYVEKGEWEIYNIGVFAFGDDDEADEWEHEVEVEYGLTDWLKLSVEGEVKREAGEDTEFEKVGFGAKVQLTERGQYFVDVGAKLSYDIGTTAGKADKIGGTLYLGKDFYDVQALANIKVGHEVGEDSEDELNWEANFGAYTEYNDFGIGAEYFADFGDFDDSGAFDDQGHYLGPIVSKEFHVGQTEAEAKLGYYVGLSDSAHDNAIKYQLEFEF